MTNNLSRVTAKIFANNAPLDTIGQFGSAQAGTKVNTQDVKEIQALAAYENGWNGAVISQRNYPTMEEFNGAMKVMSYQTAYNLQKGMPEWDANTTYYANISFCQVDGVWYQSLTNENVGNNPTSDTINWKEVNFSGGSSLITGMTFFSLDPLIDDKLHLLDGSLLPVGGVYDDFITNYIVPLAVSNPERFISEEDWQASVAQYGVCGKYVYDEQNGVRLPKVTGFIEGTLDASALGDLVEAGLPNIQGSFGSRGYGSAANENGVLGYFNNPFYFDKVQSSGANSVAATSSAPGVEIVGFDASLSSSVYGNSSTVQPQAIKGYYYIVIGTISKTDVEVNLDNVATDLNLKMGNDAANATDGAKTLMAHCAMPSNTSVNLTLGASRSIYTAPTDGYFHMYAIGNYNKSNLLMLVLSNNGEDETNSKFIQSAYTTAMTNLAVTLPVKKNDKVMVIYSNVLWALEGYSNLGLFFIPAAGSESEAN